MPPLQPYSAGGAAALLLAVKHSRQAAPADWPKIADTAAPPSFCPPHDARAQTQTSPKEAMKKWGAFLGGLAMLAAFGYGAWHFTGGRLNLPFGGPTAKKVELGAGAEVSLLLLQTISSGGTDKDAKIPALVEEDIRGRGGEVVVRAGAPSLIHVVRSRGATAMTQVMNQPARLEVAFTTVQAVDGTTIRLEPGGKAGQDSLELTRDVLQTQDVGDAVAKLYNHSETQDSIKALGDRLTGANPGAELDAPDLKRALEDVSKDMNMPKTAAAIRDGAAWSALSDAAQQAGKGDLSGLDAGQALLAVGALQELGSLAGRMGGFLEGVFKGRNIVAPVGARLKTATAEGVVVTVTPEPPGKS